MRDETDRSNRDEPSVARGGVERERTVDGEELRLALLGELHDYQVARGYPDVRGWNVVAADGRSVGQVHDLLVDVQEMRTRYLDIHIDGMAGATEERDVLVPIGAARLDETDDQVILDPTAASRLASLPRYDHGNFSRDEEIALLSAFGTPRAGVDERAFFGNRAGERADRATESDREVPLLPRLDEEPEHLLARPEDHPVAEDERRPGPEDRI